MNCIKRYIDIRKTVTMKIRNVKFYVIIIVCLILFELFYKKKRNKSNFIKFFLDFSIFYPMVLFKYNA